MSKQVNVNLPGSMYGELTKVRETLGTDNDGALRHALQLDDALRARVTKRTQVFVIHSMQGNTVVSAQGYSWSDLPHRTSFKELIGKVNPVLRARQRATPNPSVPAEPVPVTFSRETWSMLEAKAAQLRQTPAVVLQTVTARDAYLLGQARQYRLAFKTSSSETSTWASLDPVALGGPIRRDAPASTDRETSRAAQSPVTSGAPAVLPASVREANEPQTDLAL